MIMIYVPKSSFNVLSGEIRVEFQFYILQFPVFQYLVILLLKVK